MSIRNILMPTLENELDDSGFAGVYAEFVACDVCSVHDMCFSDPTRGPESCEEFIKRLIKEDTSNADRD